MSLPFRCGDVAWSAIARSAECPNLGRFSYVAANLVFYGFGEEVGWRGFALPRLQAHRTALSAALIVGAGWALWHLPLFAFAPGFSSMGVGGAFGWLASMFTGSILMTWLFNESRGSVVALAWFHGALDVLMSAPVNGCVSMVMGASLTIAGLAVPRFLGPRDLARVGRVVDESPQRPQKGACHALEPC